MILSICVLFFKKHLSTWNNENPYTLPVEMQNVKVSLFFFFFFFDFKTDFISANIYISFFLFYFIFRLYITVLVLPNIKMNPPQVENSLAVSCKVEHRLTI